MNELEKKVLLRMGVLLLTLQTTEKILKVIVDIILPKNGVIEPNEYLQRLERVDKRTMGAFLNELRQRVDIDAEFDQILADFLEMRNDLIHDVGRIPGFGYRTDTEATTAIAFLDRLLRHNDLVQKTLYGLGRRWQQQNGITFSEIEGHSYTAEIDENFAPLVDDIFYQKKKT